MTKNLYKVQKQISKKRGKLNALHEDSRDAKRLRRASAREDRLARVASETSKARQVFLDRVAFFQECLKEASVSISDADMAELVKRYIHRSDSELEQLRQERRKGRPPSKREDLLAQRIAEEEKEFKAGFWMPDLTDDDVRIRLTAWNGDWSSLSTIKFIRLSQDGDKRTSSFPPKGLS
ncbi:hypothetical protein VTN77DRAFT_2043 [Rasamsonia byssochlamydoides]|uniref:uncharacterized protein n=1 Tax=Rasamsonia byssochlamydoides TaxID=89139 RepID=UPI00374345CD